MPSSKTSEASRVKTTKAKYGEAIYRKYGSKGGQSKSLKGLKWVKVNDPERFKQIINNRGKK